MQEPLMLTHLLRVCVCVFVGESWGRGRVGVRKRVRIVEGELSKRKVEGIS